MGKLIVTNLLWHRSFLVDSSFCHIYNERLTLSRLTTDPGEYEFCLFPALSGIIKAYPVWMPLSEDCATAAMAHKTNFWKILGTSLTRNQGISFGKSDRLN
jgi:hypothetical protein